MAQYRTCAEMSAEMDYGGSGSSGNGKLRQWLIEQVDCGKYPGLVWENDEKSIFRIPWKHAGKQDYNRDEDAALFKVTPRPRECSSRGGHGTLGVLQTHGETFLQRKDAPFYRPQVLNDRVKLVIAKSLQPLAHFHMCTVSPLYHFKYV